MSEMRQQWNRVIDGQEPNGLCLLVIALFETGEQLGYDLGYFEDGDWSYGRSDGNTNANVFPTHWCVLPELPEG